MYLDHRSAEGWRQDNSEDDEGASRFFAVVLYRTQGEAQVLPEVIIYDIDLTMTLPARMTVTSGMNAIAHAVEALYSTDANPVMDSLAVQGIQSIARALPLIAKDASHREARSDALFGAWACGTCLGAVAMHLHHKLCHVRLRSVLSVSHASIDEDAQTLGGSFNMPHAETHTVVLAHAMAYNAPFVKEAASTIAKALNAPEGTSAAQALFDLAKEAGAPTSLKELGFKREDLEKAADIAAKAPYPNPAPLERPKLLQLLQNAFEGTRPT